MLFESGYFEQTLNKQNGSFSLFVTIFNLPWTVKSSLS